MIRSEGCGLAPTQPTGEFVKYTIVVSGAKDADATGKPGSWTYPRDCSGDGTNVYSLSPSNDELGAGVDGTVIRVGLTPPPNDIEHYIAPGAGCFDDAESDDSVEWPFYEAVIDTLNGTLCYDQNRVFATGNSSGGWLANQLGCIYAGNTEGYAVHGVASNQATLRTDPAMTPICGDAPMTGVWINEDDTCKKGRRLPDGASARPLHHPGLLKRQP